MPALDQIRAFLSDVRRHLRRRTALQAALHATAALIALAVLLPMIALAVAEAHGHTVAWLGFAVVVVIAAVSSIFGGLVPLRRWHSDWRVARHVGQQAPTLASDLLSAVELGAGLAAAPGTVRVSEDLTRAFIEHTASQIAPLTPADFVPARPLRRAFWTWIGTMAAGAVIIVLMPRLLGPNALGRGWERLLEGPPPGPVDGAYLASTPLVGDMRITLEYPAYTGRPAQVLPSTSGDFRAMPGTVVTIETRALEPVAAARVVFGNADVEPGEGLASLGQDAGATRARDQNTRQDTRREVMMEVDAEGRQLRAQFPIRNAATYRFWTEGKQGKRQVEIVPRRIESEPDLAPQVQLFAPADELDVTSLKRVELAYIAEDDYGISEIALVWTSRGRSERKPLSVPESSRTSAQNKFLWDLAELQLEPGVPVAYHLEVTDNDAVSGPKVTRSRSFVLRVFSPREKHEQLIARQRELFEKMLRMLGVRLVLPAEPAPAGPDSDVSEISGRQTLARETADMVVEIGSILAALEKDELANKALRTALEGMRTRIDGLTRAELAVVDKLAAQQGHGALAKAELVRLAGANARQVTELEDDVLILANWLDRQQMENLLAISDEVKHHQDRLRQLFDELERTGSPEVLAEIEREMRALEARLAEMAQERSNLPEDVLDRFVHAEAMQNEAAESCMDEVRTLLAAGKADEAQRKMESCMQTLDQAAGAMEQALRELRGDSFSEEERKFGQLMDELADLAQDQKDLAADADALWEQYAARADELMRDKTSEARRQVSRTVDRLRQRLDRVPEAGLTPFAKEELEIVEARLQDLEEMLADGDLAEALAMARQVREGVDIMAEELSAALQDEQDQPWGDRTADAEWEVQRARPLARELVEELEAHTPSPDQIMNAEDRRQLERLRRRQEAVSERAKRMMERAEQLGQQLPGQAGGAMASGVGQARQQMDRAAERMRLRDPSGGKHESRNAADTLERTLENAQGAARQRQAQGRAGLHDEPIRIPGAEEYKPPEEFREDILEAMKREQAPEGFGELVKRYYEELIR